VALYVDHLACERRDNLAAADTAERADCRGVCSAAGFERRNRRRAARLRQGADRHRACCQSLEELAARWPRNCLLVRAIVAAPFQFILIFIFLLDLDFLAVTPFSSTSVSNTCVRGRS